MRRWLSRLAWLAGGFVLGILATLCFFQFTVNPAPNAAGSGPPYHDNIDLPFLDDPSVLGAWRAVDFVESPTDFRPGQRQIPQELYLKALTFLPGGKTDVGWMTWTRGVLIHPGDRTASRYRIQSIDGRDYLFLEWKSGDYIFRGQTPSYYVFQRASAAADHGVF